MYLWSKSDGFKWSFMEVYGAARRRRNLPSLPSFVRMCENEIKPLLFEGDYNIVCSI
jgi:hypothetical protein